MHDLDHPATSAGGFDGLLRQTVLPFLAELAAPNRLVFKTSSPKAGIVACARGWRNASRVPGEAAVEALNAAATAAAAALSPPALLLDEHAFLLPLSEPSHNLFHHCTSVLRSALDPRGPDGSTNKSAARGMGGVYAGCRATVHALFNLLCPQS